MVDLVEQRFPEIDQIYESHHQIELPLNMMKIKQDKNMAIHMPLCQMEDLGGYRPLAKDEIIGSFPSSTNLSGGLHYLNYIINLS